MLYFLGFGLLLAFLLKRNPIGIIHNFEFRAPYLLIVGFLVQVILQELKIHGYPVPVYLLLLTFFCVLIGLLLNSKLVGVRWIIVGCILNILALTLNGGLMPVSMRAAEIAGISQDIHFNLDSRHQMMQFSLFWWLGDWIPFIKHVLSPGDLLVGIGLIRYVVNYSVSRGRNV